MRRHRGYQVRRVISDTERTEEKISVPTRLADSDASNLSRKIDKSMSQLEGLLFFNDIFQADKENDQLDSNESSSGKSVMCMLAYLFAHVCVR